MIVKGSGLSKGLYDSMVEVWVWTVLSDLGDDIKFNIFDIDLGNEMCLAFFIVFAWV